VTPISGISPPPLSSDVPLTQNYKMFFQEKLPTMAEETLFFQGLALEIMEQTGGEEESDKKEEADRKTLKVWTLYFDGFKSQEGSGEWCILIDPKGK
jgi:hypothetical protein